MEAVPFLRTVSFNFEVTAIPDRLIVLLHRHAIPPPSIRRQSAGLPEQEGEGELPLRSLSEPKL